MERCVGPLSRTKTHALLCLMLEVYPISIGTFLELNDSAGQIQLKSRLILTDGYVTIAGQTAPGKGVSTRSVNLPETHFLLILLFRNRDHCLGIRFVWSQRCCLA